MATYRRPWFRYVIQIRGSVIPAIVPRTLICGGFGLIIAILYSFGLPVSIDILASLIPNIVLGLMLVFRTNTAYERFWEGRKLWGALNNAIRNLARQIWVAIPAESAQVHAEKKQVLYLLVAFAVATKLHLRDESVNEELEELLPRSHYLKLKDMHNPPLEVAFWISDYLQQQYRCDRLNTHQLTALQELLNMMVDGLGGCERILKTPIPLAYAIHLKQLLLLYCLSLPSQIIDQSGWWTPILVAMISFTLFGIEEIGIEIENPFGHDANDLPLDAICTTIRRNIEDLMTLTPTNLDPSIVRDYSES
jgi:putative membrane protein